MKRLLYVSALCVVGVALLVLMSGCQTAAEKAVEQVTGVQVDEEGDSVTVETEEGKATVGGEGTDIPSDWPSDVPIYPDTTVVSTVDYEVSGAKNMGVTLDSTDDAKTINDWYVDEVEKNGWKVTAKASTNGSYVISATKGDQQLSVAIAADLGTDNTGVNLMVISGN